MKRTFITVFVFVALSTTAVFAQPRLEMQDSVDWGQIVPDVPPGQVAKVFAEVKLKNTGDSVLNILEVRPGCGCTSAPLDEDLLQPGEETTMRVTLNLPLSNGPLNKRITIRSNDPVQGTRLLHLHATVQRPLQLSSSFIPFNKGKVGEAIEGVVSFTVYGKNSVRITAVAEREGLTVTTPMPLVVEPGETGKLSVTYTPDNPGPFTVDVSVSTSLKGYDSFDLKGYGSADAK